MPNVGACHSSLLSVDVRPKKSYGIELGDEVIGAERVRCEVGGVVIHSLFTLLLPVDLFQLS